MIEEKEYTQSDLNNAIVKAITDMTTVLERQQKEIEELKATIYILMGDKQWNTMTLYYRQELFLKC